MHFCLPLFQSMAIKYKEQKGGDSVDAVAGPSQNPNKTGKGKCAVVVDM